MMMKTFSFYVNCFCRNGVCMGACVLLLFLVPACTQQKNTEEKSMAASAQMQEDNRLYYTCGMHPSVRVSPKEFDAGQTNCPICNMKLIPVYTEEKKEEPEYYGCGMKGADHVFSIEGKNMKKCPICGMDLKPLTADEAETLRGVVGKVHIQGEEARLAGVTREPVATQHLFKMVRTVGKVAYDPQLVIAQEEYVSSLNALGKMEAGSITEIIDRAQSLVESSRRKLLLLGLSDNLISELEKKRTVEKNLILPSETMWIYADVYEYELPWIKEGQEIRVTTESLPGETFTGVVSSINPVINSRTRSVRVRAQVQNPGSKLKPEMYVDVTIMSMYVSPRGDTRVLAIPQDAVLNTGTRTIVWVDLGGGDYEGREVIIGPEAVAMIDDEEVKMYPVLGGLSDGEMVVIKANFLIDSQSQLSGTASAAYGGALNAAEASSSAMHQH